MIETPQDKSYLVDVDSGLLTLTFNRPEFGNSVPSTTIPCLAQLFQAAQDDLSIRCILVRSTGKIFSAGGDVASFARSLDQDVSQLQAEFQQRLVRLGTLAQAVIKFDRPIVAEVNGPAAGAGLLYPLAADVALGDPTSAFVFAHQRIGLSPDGGVTYLLPRVVGARTARLLLLTAAKVDAQEALRIGLLSKIVPSADLAVEAAKLARRLANGPLTAVREAKALLLASLDRSLEEQLRAETAAIVKCVGDQDFAEGVRAFVEKRVAKFGSAHNAEVD